MTASQPRALSCGSLARLLPGLDLRDQLNMGLQIQLFAVQNFGRQTRDGESIVRIALCVDACWRQGGTEHVSYGCAV